LRLARQEEEERRIKVEMKLKEEQAMAVEEQFSNVQEEVEIKTKKLKKLWLKYQESEQNLKDEKKAFQVHIRYVCVFSFVASMFIK
jgi:kinesin family member 3B